MRPLRLTLAALLLPLAGGCSMFDPTEPLAFETLLHRTDALTRLDTDGGAGPLFVLRSEAEEAAFAEGYGLVVPLPEVDYAVVSVVGVLDGPMDANGSVTITRVEYGGGTVRLETVHTGRRVRGEEGYFPVHLVVVPRIEGPIHRMEADGRTSGGR